MPLSPTLFLIRDHYKNYLQHLNDLAHWLWRLNGVKLKRSQNVNEFLSSFGYFTAKVLFLFGFLELANSVFLKYKCKQEMLEQASEIKFILETNKKVILADLARINSRFLAQKPEMTGDSWVVNSQWEKNAIFKCFNEQGWFFGPIRKESNCQKPTRIGRRLCNSNWSTNRSFWRFQASSNLNSRWWTQIFWVIWLFFLFLKKAKHNFPFIDLTRFSKEFINIQISLICDCYIYELTVSLRSLERLVANFLKSAQNKRKYFMPTWVKQQLSTKFFIVNVDEVPNIHIHKIVLKHLEINTQSIIANLVRILLIMVIKGRVRSS